MQWTLLGVAILTLSGCESPDLKRCDVAIQGMLKAPASYKRISAQREKGGWIITYDAVNSFNAPLRSSGECIVSGGYAEWYEGGRPSDLPIPAADDMSLNSATQAAMDDINQAAAEVEAQEDQTGPDTELGAEARKRAEAAAEAEADTNRMAAEAANAAMHVVTNPPDPLWDEGNDEMIEHEPHP